MLYRTANPALTLLVAVAMLQVFVPPSPVFGQSALQAAISPISGPIGTTVAIHATGFTPGDTILVGMNDGLSCGQPAGRDAWIIRELTVPASGTFDVEFTIAEGDFKLGEAVNHFNPARLAPPAPISFIFFSQQFGFGQGPYGPCLDFTLTAGAAPTAQATAVPSLPQSGNAGLTGDGRSVPVLPLLLTLLGCVVVTATGGHLMRRWQAR